MDQYRTADSFEVDHEELSDVPSVQAFTLGVEWAMVRELAKRGDALHAHPIHPDNSRRIEHLLSSYGYWQEWDHRDDWSFVTASTERPE